MSIKLTVREYSERKKTTTGAVYQKIKSNKLNTELINDTIYVVVDDDEKVEEDVLYFKNKIFLLEQKVEILKEEKTFFEKSFNAEKLKTEEKERDFQKRLHESNIIIMKSQENISNLTENIKAIEYKKSEIEEELINEKNKKWWQKIIK